MRDLLEFLIKKITGIKDFTIKEESENSFTRFIVKTNPDQAGLVIGKNGKTIKMIGSLLKVRAILGDRAVTVSVEEK